MARVSQQQRSIRRALRRVRIIMLLVSLEVCDSCDLDAIEGRTEEDVAFFVLLLLLERSTLRTLTANRNLHMRRGFCDNKPSQHHPIGGRRARPCRRVVLSGNTRPGRKPRRAHTHGVDRGETPQATNTSCVTGSLLPASKAWRQHSRLALLSRPFPSDPPETPLRHPQRILREPSPQGPWGQSQQRTAEASDTALSRGGKGAT